MEMLKFWQSIPCTPTGMHSTLDTPPNLGLILNYMNINSPLQWKGLLQLFLEA